MFTPMGCLLSVSISYIIACRDTSSWCPHLKSGVEVLLIALSTSESRAASSRPSMLIIISSCSLIFLIVPPVLSSSGCAVSTPSVTQGFSVYASVSIFSVIGRVCTGLLDCSCRAGILCRPSMFDSSHFCLHTFLCLWEDFCLLECCMFGPLSSIADEEGQISCCAEPEWMVTLSGLAYSSPPSELSSHLL